MSNRTEPKANAKLGPAFDSCIKLLALFFLGNAVVVAALSWGVSDACEIARLHVVRQLWPPNMSFLTTDQLTNPQICMTLIMMSCLGASLFIWLLIAIIWTGRHLYADRDLKGVCLFAGIAALAYWTSGFPAVMHRSFYRVGLEEPWWSALFKSGLGIAAFMAARSWRSTSHSAVSRRYLENMKKGEFARREWHHHVNFLSYENARLEKTKKHDQKSIF